MKKVGIIRCQQTEDMCPGTMYYQRQSHRLSLPSLREHERRGYQKGRPNDRDHRIHPLTLLAAKATGHAVSTVAEAVHRQGGDPFAGL